MNLHQKLALALTLGLSTAAANASPVVYILADSQQFGTVDLSTGAFTQIGPGVPVGGDGLVQGSGGTLLTLGFDGNLNAINPATGILSVVGPTGLADCSLPGSVCGLHAANGLGKLGSNYYATDFANNLYSVNPSTGLATLIGPTGIPPLTFTPHAPVPGDPDGSFYIYDESMFNVAGKLYIDFDTGTFDPTTFIPAPAISPNLYQINPVTGVATLITPSTFGLTAITGIDGIAYAFDAPDGEAVTLNLANGTTSLVSDVDPAVGIIDGAVSTVPEPASLALVGSGLAVFAAAIKRRRHNRN